MFLLKYKHDTLNQIENLIFDFTSLKLLKQRTYGKQRTQKTKKSLRHLGYMKTFNSKSCLRKFQRNIKEIRDTLQEAKF